MKLRKRGIRRPDRHAREAALHAENLRDRRSARYNEKIIPPEFHKYARRVLLPLLVLTGYKIREQQRVAIHCLHNAVLAGMAEATVADTRRKTQPGIKVRSAVWDAIERAGLVVKQLGSEASGMDTRYFATPALVAHFRDWPLSHRLNLQLGRNTMTPDTCSSDALVVLRARRKDGGKVLPMPQDELDARIGDISVRQHLAAIENDIEVINRCNMWHRWTAYREIEDGHLELFKPNVCLKQLHSGQLMQYARLYTWSSASAQSIKKEERPMMEIDGEAVAEFDYGQHNIRLLYHTLHVEPGRGDLYRPELILPGPHRNARMEAAARELIKLATNTCLNTSTRKEAAIGVQGLLCRKPSWATIVRLEGIKASDVVERIMAAHPDVAHHFFTMAGAKLQTTDGDIMRHILMAFAIEDRPVLGIHDSVVCRVTDARFAKAIMSLMYQKLVGFWPVVRRVY